jgi:hypothetical protein
MKNRLFATIVVVPVVAVFLSACTTTQAVVDVAGPILLDFAKSSLAAELKERCPQCPPATFTIGSSLVDAAFNAAKNAAIGGPSREAEIPPELQAMRAFLVAPTPGGAGMTEAAADTYLDILATAATRSTEAQGQKR